MYNQLCIFDICGTLFKSNTTFDFLKWYLRDNKSYCIYTRVIKSMPWKALNRCSRDLMGIDLTKIIALHFIKGVSRDELVASADRFVREFLLPIENVQITNELKQYIKNNAHQVYFVSATIDVVGNAIARYFGTNNVYTSELEYKSNGVCTGKIKKDLLGKKITTVNALSAGNSVKAVYTDDLTDENILSVADEKHIIVYKRTEKKWKKLIAKNNWKPILYQMD